MQKWLSFVVVAVVCVGCSTAAGPELVEPLPDGESSVATSIAPLSTALLALDGTEYPFIADCYDAGAGAVIVLAEGTEDPSVSLIVQAIVGEAYLSFTDSVGEVFEPSLEHLVDFTVDDGTVSSGVVNMVTNLDLAAGTSEPAGVASFEVTCGSYIHGAPEGY